MRKNIASSCLLLHSSRVVKVSHIGICDLVCQRARNIVRSLIEERDSEGKRGCSNIYILCSALL